MASRVRGGCFVRRFIRLPLPVRATAGMTSKVSFSSIQRSPATPSRMLQIIGLGLADETDVSVKGFQLIKKAERVYLEAYTSILLCDTAKLVSPCP